MLKTLLMRIYQMGYQKRKFILVIDMLSSLLATFLALLVISILTATPMRDSYAMVILLIASLTSLLLFLFFQLNREVIRHFTYRGVFKIVKICFVKALVIFLFVQYATDLRELYIYLLTLGDFLLSLFFLIGVRIAMLSFYYTLIDSCKLSLKNTLIYGTQDFSTNLTYQIRNNPKLNYRIKGFLSTNSNKAGFHIAGLPVLYVNDPTLPQLLKAKEIKNIIFPSQERFYQEKERFVKYCLEHNISLFVIGNITKINEESYALERQIKPISIENILNRDEIEIDIDLIGEKLKGEIVLITGAAGSIGSEIANQVAQFNVKMLILFDSAETPMHELQIKLTNDYPQHDVRYVLGDVRSESRVEALFKRYNPTIVFHAAAYKHVPLIEENPCEGVLTNIAGTINIAQKAIEFGVKKFIMISTDKAVNPTNVMGATKRIAERCVQAFNAQQKTQFITTRFGNVLGSNGSVIPRFKKQIADGGPVTVTHPDIIRYFMTIPEACRLVLQASVIGKAGEIMAFDMGEQVKIAELARKMIILSGFIPDKDIKITFTGLRPGEKLYEELLTNKENSTATSHKKIFIAQSNSTTHEDFFEEVVTLIEYAKATNIEDTVRQMKKICPEFISNNSKFEKFDKS